MKEDKNYWWYKKTYQNLINTRLIRGTIKKRGDGYNKHHIIPKCVGGEDVESNYVLLTFREHIIAHMLLIRIYPEENGLKYALLRMIQSSHSDRKENTYKVDKKGNKVSINIATKMFEELNKASIEHLREKLLGSKLSEETKNKLSDSHLGIKYSEEHKSNLSNQRKGRKYQSRFRVTNKLTGDIYKSISECSEREEISRKQILKSDTYLVEESYETTRGKRILGPDGTIYSNLSDCSKKTGYYKPTILRWLKNNKKGYKYID